MKCMLRYLPIILLMLLSFFAGVAYNPLANFGAKDTKNKTVRFERHSYEDANSHNRISAYINMLYVLSYDVESSICYFNAPSIQSYMPGLIRYENRKYWKKGVLTVLKNYYLPLLENRELVKKFPQIQSSYDQIKENDLWRHYSLKSSFLKSAEYLKDLQKKLIAEKKYIPEGYFSGIKSVRQELSVLAKSLNNKIAYFEKSEAKALLSVDEMDDLIYEAQGSFWAMGFMISGTTGEVVMHLNQQELMDDLTNVQKQLNKMYKDEHISLHEDEKFRINNKHRKNHLSKAKAVMKKQLRDINDLLSLISILECDKLCQMRKRNDIKGY